MNYRNLAPVTILVVALLSGVGALVGQAKGKVDKGDTANNFAIVDMDKVYDLSDAPQIVEQKKIALIQESNAKLRTFSQASLLEQKELLELADLLSKPALKQPEQDRVQALVKISEGIEVQLQALRLKQSLTPAETKMMQDLSERKRVFDNRMMPTMQGIVQDTDTALIMRVRADQMTRIRTIVGQLAKEKGFTGVFDNRAMVYSATDLTELTLKKMAKK